MNNFKSYKQLKLPKMGWIKKRSERRYFLKKIPTLGTVESIFIMSPDGWKYGQRRNVK